MVQGGLELLVLELVHDDASYACAFVSSCAWGEQVEEMVAD